MSCFGTSSSAIIVAPPPPVQVDRLELDAVFQLCRTDKWREVWAIVQQKPWLALTPITMDNHIQTTILHQAITSKGDTAVRAMVVSTILSATPQAARIKNGYGSLPLHVIAQRNTKIDAPTKEKLILQLIQAYKGALIQEGGVGKRTPLHIIFTDYISPHLTKIMIENGKEACFLKDKKGYLPAHVACSRHCSPEKLRMLLAVHPGSLYEKTSNGHTLLSLATSTATKSHPNYALIDELNRQMQQSPPRLHPMHPSLTSTSSPPMGTFASMVSLEGSDSSSRGRLDSNDSSEKSLPRAFSKRSQEVSTPKKRSSRKRRHSEQDNTSPATMLDPVDLLLHFSRNGTSRAQDEASPYPRLGSGQFAEV